MFSSRTSGRADHTGYFSPVLIQEGESSIFFGVPVMGHRDSLSRFCLADGKVRGLFFFDQCGEA